MKKVMVMLMILIFCVLLVACKNNTENSINNQEQETPDALEQQNSQKEEKMINEKYDVSFFKYADNKHMEAMLNYKDNIVIKENKGIVITGLAPDAGVIEMNQEKIYPEKNEWKEEHYEK